MAKTKTQERANTQSESKKQRRKQAREEARLMLKLEWAKKDVQKTKKKVAKVLSNLEVNEKLVQGLEQKLVQLRETQPEVASANGIQQESGGDQSAIAASPNLEASIPPAEVHDDISVAQNEQSAPITDGHVSLSSEADEDSVSILASVDPSWLSPAISEEVAEAIAEEAVSSIGLGQATTVISEETVALADGQEASLVDTDTIFSGDVQEVELVGEEIVTTTTEEGPVLVYEEIIAADVEQDTEIPSAIEEPASTEADPEMKDGEHAAGEEDDGDDQRKDATSGGRSRSRTTYPASQHRSTYTKDHD